MKNLILGFGVALLVAGCSRSEETGKEISKQMQAPMEKAQSVADQVKALRTAE